MLGDYESNTPACKDWQPREHPVVLSNASNGDKDLEPSGKDGASESTSASASSGEADGHSSSSSSSHSSNPDVASQDVSADIHTAPKQCLRLDSGSGSRPEIDPPDEVVQKGGAATSVMGHTHLPLHEQAQE